MKTKEELLALKAEYERLNTKLQELSEAELLEVTGGCDPLRPCFINGRIVEDFENPGEFFLNPAGIPSEHNVMLPDHAENGGVVLITGEDPKKETVR